MTGAQSIAAETSGIPVWGTLPPEWQAQCKKAALAAVVAGGTVTLVPILNPLHRSHASHHKPQARPQAAAKSWTEHARHHTHHEHEHEHGHRGR